MKRVSNSYVVYERGGGKYVKVFLNFYKGIKTFGERRLWILHQLSERVRVKGLFFLCQ